MLIAWLLGLSHGNWVFWTAFLVIAGSTGESLRRISMRVAATVGGAVAGAALVLILPDDLIVSVLMVILCLSLAVYAIPISYPGMVFWSTVAVVVDLHAVGRYGARHSHLATDRHIDWCAGRRTGCCVDPPNSHQRSIRGRCGRIPRCG